MEIFKKIPLIMKEVAPIAKGRKNAQQGYAYRGVDDVMNELAPILCKHGVFPVTKVIDAQTPELITSKTGTQGYHAIRRYKITLYADDGSSVSGVVEGEASDFGDKACGKAHSYAYRDFLMKTFVIPTEGDHDTDAHTPEIATAKPPITDELLQRAINKVNTGGDAGEIWSFIKTHNSYTAEQETKFKTETNGKRTLANRAVAEQS